MKKKPPLLLIKAQESLPKLEKSRHLLHGRPGGVYAMRRDRLEKVMALMRAMLKSACLQFGGIVCAVAGGEARALTVKELAADAGIGRRENATRCLRDLSSLGYVHSSRQKKIPLIGDRLSVSSVLRAFTPAFWRALGLWSLYCEAIQYASTHGRLRFKLTWLAVARAKKAWRKFKEENSEQAENNRAFLQAVECRKRRGDGCAGGAASAKVCGVCRRIFSPSANGG